MPTTLRWLIESSSLENLHCVSWPEKLDTPISSVNVLDNLDVVKWIKPNELVLTSGYLFVDDEQEQRQGETGEPEDHARLPQQRGKFQRHGRRPLSVEMALLCHAVPCLATERTRRNVQENFIKSLSLRQLPLRQVCYPVGIPQVRGD